MKKAIFIFIVLMISIEIFLRMFYGFCDTVLYKSDLDYEYIAQPNQKRYRFRNNIFYNSYSMRSKEVDTASYKILGLGDSVINGGVLTDNQNLATSILSDSLTRLYKKTFQFLNISAGSWGPDNCYAYLKKNGDFNAKSIWLFVSSHDAFDNMEFNNVVGLHPSYPMKQYSFAIYELIDRYLIPRIFKINNNFESDRNKFLGINKKKENSNFNSGFKNILNFCQNKNIPMKIYLHADKNEYLNKNYNKQGQDIIKFAAKNKIEILKSLDFNFNLNHYRDDIHLNSLGQGILASVLYSNLTNLKLN